MHHPTAFVIKVAQHWLKREIAHHELMLLPTEMIIITITITNSVTITIYLLNFINIFQIRQQKYKKYCG